MKKLLFTVSLVLVIGCNSPNPPCDDKINSNGFIKDTDQEVMLASQEAVDLFKMIDKAWFDRDYEKIKSLVSEEATLRFASGETGKGPQSLIDLIEKEYQENIANEIPWGWSTEYAFAVKNTPTDNPQPGDIGEWVLAEFSSEESYTIEWYQFNKGQLINWYQFNTPKK